MEFRMLGPVEVVAGGQPVDAGPPRQRAVLAALLVGAGQVVGRETVMDRVWGGDPPANARETLRTYLTRIRRVLEKAAEIEGQKPVELVHRPGGYLLRADPDTVDLHRFRSLQKGNNQEVTRLREAVALWRGEPLTGLTGDWAARTREIWTQERLGAVTAWAQGEIRVGNAEEVIGPLTGLAAEHPLVESLTAALMRALHAAGRSTEALDRCARHRAVLADTHGTDQSADLQELYAAILRGEVERPTRTPMPAQLPADVPAFAGRKKHLVQLDGHLGKHTAVMISAVSGTAGVGKTALAVHWAHRVRDAFPDGQLYVNLRGFDPGGQAMEPVDALRGFLDALDVPPHRIPHGVDAQAALYRSLLDGKRILVVLDNARDVEQARPLLPGAPGCLVVVTSRNQLTGMITAGSAQPIMLEVMTQAEARDLLAARLGPERVAAEPEATDEIIGRCALLPLALTVVAARAATHPQFSLASLAAELRDSRLDVLDGGDHASDVRSVFSWSYHQLSPEAAGLFRLLGLHPGPDVSAAMASSLARRTARPMLSELTRAHLLTEHVPGRYTFHDVLRDYAAELADAIEDVDEARLRLLNHALYTAHAAARRLNPHRDPIEVDLGAAAENPPDALAWFTEEHAVLLALVKLAADHGFDKHVWQLAWSILTYLDLQGHWLDCVDTQQQAVAATRRLSDRPNQAGAHRSLAQAYARLGRSDDAHVHLNHAGELFGDLGDHVGQGHVHYHLAALAEQGGDYRRGLDEITRARELYRTADYRRGEAGALNAIGWFRALLGEPRQALSFCEQGLAIYQEMGNRFDEGPSWDSIGFIHQQIGEHDRALDCFQRALEALREVGDRHFESQTLTKLGESHLAVGDLDGARDAWQQAVTILTELGRHDEMEAVRAKLADAANPAGSP